MTDNLSFAGSPGMHAESELRAAVIAAFRASGVSVDEHVSCAAGTADLVTSDRTVIIECKIRLTRVALYQAIGQVLLYRQCLNPRARALIIGYEVSETKSLVPLIAKLGIDVVPWIDEGTEKTPKQQNKTQSPRRANTHSSPILTVPRSSLHWTIASLARTQGILNPSAFATQMGIGRQGLYLFWNDRAAHVTREQHARFAIALQAEPGDWFVWSEREREAESRNLTFDPDQYTDRLLPLRFRYLRWNVAAQAMARGLDVRRLGYRAEVQPRTAEMIWQGVARAAALVTLARIAQALDEPSHPFSIGTLFEWRVS